MSVAPADLVALRGRAQFALAALGRGFEGAATAHFFENSFGVELGLQAFESPVDRFASFYNDCALVCFHNDFRVRLAWGRGT